MFLTIALAATLIVAAYGMQKVDIENVPEVFFATIWVFLFLIIMHK